MEPVAELIEDIQVYWLEWHTPFLTGLIGLAAITLALRRHFLNVRLIRRPGRHSNPLSDRQQA